MNEVSNVAERPQTNPLVEFKGQLRALAERNELVLPSNIKPEAFQNAAIVAVQDNPKILRCDRQSVFKAIRRLAVAGLVPDGREAALVPFKTKIDNQYVDVCQAMPMVFGLIKAARNSGDIKDIRAHIVYQKEIEQDRFEYVVGDEERLTHSPILFGDRGQPRACYAIAVLRDGSVIREFLTDDEIDKIRRSSANQRIYEKGKRPSVSDEPLGIWADWQTEMWKKSAIRRLCKRLPLSSEDLRRIQTSDEMEEAMRDVTPPPKSSEEHFRKLMGQGRAVDPADTPDDTPDSTPDDSVEDAEVVGGDTPEVDEKSDPYKEGGKAFDDWGDTAVRPEGYEDGSFEALNWDAGFRDAKLESGEGD